MLACALGSPTRYNTGMEKPDESDDRIRNRRTQAVTALTLAPIVYVLSSGPVIATGFWLREATGWNGFYAVMWAYYPLVRHHDTPFERYIGWRVDLFGTTGPG